MEYFPAIISDELLFSVLARHRLHSGATTTAQHLKTLYGRRHAIASFDLSGDLEALTQRMGAVGIGASRLASEHTLLPYYTSHNNAILWHDAAAALSNGDAAALKHRIGVNAWSIRPPTRTRICPVCAENQLGECGEFMLLRSHQLPGSVVCHQHGAILHECGVAFERRDRHTFVIPQLDEHRALFADDIAYDGAEHILKRIANLQASLLTPKPFVTPVDYRLALAKLGLMRSACKVDRRQLSDAVGQFYEPVSRFLPPATRNFGAGSWVEDLTRNRQKSVHPLFHVMMAVFINSNTGTTRPSRKSLDARLGFGAGPWECLNPLAPHFGQDVIRFVKAYRNRGAVVGTFECACGYVYTKGISSSGVLGSARFKAGGPLLDQRLQALVLPGAKLRQVAREVGLDPKTVIHLALTLGLNVPWKTRPSGKPATLPVSSTATVPNGLSRKPSSYRRAGPKKDWEALDRELAIRARHAIKALLRTEPPSRVTFAAVERTVRSVGWVAKRRAKLPKTAKVIEQDVESTRHFQHRRIKYHMGCAPDAQPWEIMRLAGLKTLELVLQEFERQNDWRSRSVG